MPAQMTESLTVAVVIAGDALHYGQKLRIVANPMVQGEMLDGVGGSRPLYLYSRPAGTTHFAKYSRHQLVAFTDRASYDSVWQASSCPTMVLLLEYAVMLMHQF